jgi:isovaleryl-CoA dehydrogenase
MTAGTATSDLVKIARDLASNSLAPRAERTDAEAIWPADSLRDIAAAGLFGLHVPKRLGGHGLGLLALAEVAEELGVGCSSTAMCYAMHCVATAVIAAKATPDQEQRYLEPIAQGRHLTTLALSEPGTGAHFYLPRVTFRGGDGGYVVGGEKSFVTNGGHADSYVMSAVAEGEEFDPGTFTCLLLDRDAPGLVWAPPWSGFGMRGNSSRGATLNDVGLPSGNRLGVEGDQIWYVFEVVAPYFLTAMSGVYLGVARAALDLAVQHLGARSHTHTGQRLVDNPVLADQVADMWRMIERSRALMRHAATLGDQGSAEAPPALFAAKIEIAETATQVTNLAMSLLGGRGYQQNGAMGRLMRDAQASHVMSPTTHLLKNWLGRTVLGQSIF